MNPQEKQTWFESAVHYLEKHTTLKWAHSFLLDLKRAHKPINLCYYMGAAYKTEKRLMRENEDYLLVEGKLMDSMLSNYASCMNRLIIIDHEVR